MQRARNITYYLSAAVALSTFLVYLPALRNEFVYWDDNLYIFENPNIRSLDAAFFRWAFLGFHVSNWHPLTWISHAVDYALWGLNPLGHHLTNIILHTVNTALVVVLALKLLETARERSAPNGPAPFLNDRAVMIAAGVTGLLFGIHPVHVESVAWVSERKDLLCALFFLMSIIAYTKYATKPSVSFPLDGNPSLKKDPGQAGMTKPGRQFLNRRYLAALGLFILALMSKPMAVSLPAVLLILDWYPFGRVRSWKTLWSAGAEKLPFFVLSLASSVLTILAQRAGGAIVSAEQISLSVRALTAAKSLVAYLGKMLLPLNLVPLYPYPRDVSLSSFEYIYSIILMVGITTTCVMLARKQKFWFSAWGYYVATLIPVLGIVQVGNQSMADRYTYLPSLGPFFVVGLGVPWISKSLSAGNKKSLFLMVFSALTFCALLIALSYPTFKQIAIWENSLDLWSYTIEKEPGIALAYYNRGIFYYNDGRLTEANEDFGRAIALNPFYYDAYNNRGIVFEKMGKFDNAIADYNRAIALNPSHIEAYNNRGLTFDEMGQFDRAIADFDRAIALNPSHIEAYNNRGLIFDKMGQFERALADYDRAIALNPYYYKAYYNRGLIYNKMGQFDRALVEYDRAISLNPSYDEAYNNRGATFYITGQVDRAIEDYDRSIALNPSNFKTYYNRGLAFNKLGQFDKAAKDFDKAKVLQLLRQ